MTRKETKAKVGYHDSKRLANTFSMECSVSLRLPNLISVVYNVSVYYGTVDGEGG